MAASAAMRSLVMKQFSHPLSLTLLAAAAALLAGSAASVGAQTAAPAASVAPSGTPVPAAGVSRPGFDSKPIHVAALSDDEHKEVVMISVAIAPGGSSPAHTHPGDCVGTVVDGQIELRALGKDPRRVQAGDAFGNPRGTVHQFVNVGDKPVRMITTLVVDKGKPRTMMQPDFK
jgi:quercetin dioxygenase-like cupin family protein